MLTATGRVQEIEVAQVDVQVRLDPLALLEDDPNPSEPDPELHDRLPNEKVDLAQWSTNYLSDERWPVGARRTREALRKEGAHVGTRGSPVLLERDVSVLARRASLALGERGLQRVREHRPRAARLDHLVHVAA